MRMWAGSALARIQAAQAAALAPLLSLAAAAVQRTGLAALGLAKASAKLGYVATALLAGVVEQGFCTASEEAAGEADAGAGAFQEAEGTVRCLTILRNIHVLVYRVREEGLWPSYIADVLLMGVAEEGFAPLLTYHGQG